MQGAPSQTESTAMGGAFGRFFFWLLFFPAIAYFAAFGVVRAPSYEHWSRSQWGPMLDYAFDTGRQDADVVIFGDSSAFIGVNPRLINQKLGIKSLVLPNTVGSLPIINDLALQRYLARSRAPRLLVLYFSAWNLDYNSNENIRPFEGEEMLFRHSSWSEIASFALHHPIETLAFPLRLYSTFGPGILRAMMAGEDRAHTTARALGHADDPDPFPPIRDQCILPPALLKRQGTASVEQLAQKYRAQRLDVMVYVAPVPACGGVAPLLTRQYRALDAAPPIALPPHAFLADPNFAHIEPSFVPQASELFATALAKRLGISDTASSKGGDPGQPNRP